MPETSIRPALPAQELAGPLIAEHHAHLTDARILFLFTTAKRKKANRVVLGTAARLGVVARYLSSGLESIDTGYDFMILLSEKQWSSLKAAQRLALVDHCLCRCGQRVTVNTRTGAETVTWCTLAPDVEEFSAVVERHGLWLKSQQEFHKRAGRQLPLEEDVEASRARAPRRKTVAEPDGIVVSSERVDEGQTHFVGDDCDPPHAELQTGAEPHSNNGSASEYTPSWQEKTGVGSSEPERRRRGRAPRSAEAIPSA